MNPKRDVVYVERLVNYNTKRSCSKKQSCLGERREVSKVIGGRKLTPESNSQATQAAFPSSSSQQQLGADGGNCKPESMALDENSSSSPDAEMYTLKKGCK